MRMPHGKLWKLALCALCAATLTLSAWAAGTPGAKQGAVFDTGNGDLFYGYLLQRAGAADRAALMDAGSRLGEKDRALYDFLKGRIAKVAAGEETETVFTLAHDDFPTVWTAEDLGVTSCNSDEGMAAFDAELAKCFAYDTRAVIDALLADCPYELYWYDITAGASYGGDAIGYSVSRARFTLNETPTYSVEMTVSLDYGQGTTVNRSLHAGIENTVANAKAIVKKYQGKSDYDKLLAYSTEICNLVAYNDDAADNSTNTPYGDPWQLISVFDNDPETNVVCEGYSKAFKYLCDLSAFDSPEVECYLVTGTLVESAGAWPHMWNLVTMENGKSYLVDITNSDDDDEPEPDYLFLKGGDPDDDDATQYTFHDLPFVYDEDTINLWGQDLLTLDTADYKDAAPVEPAPDCKYSVDIAGGDGGLDELLAGTTLDVVREDEDAEADIILFLVFYSEEGKMTNAQCWEMSLSPSTSVETQALPESVDAAYAKLFFLNESFAPLVSPLTLE